MTTALAVIADVTIVTALALLICQALRRTPASLRHMILAASLGAAAVAPVLEATLPQWELPLLAGASVTTSGLTLESDLAPAPAAVAVAQASAPRLTWTAAFAAVWGIGAFVVLAGLLAGIVRLTSTTRRCRPIHSRAWRERAAALSIQNGLVRPVAVLECPDRALLLTWGLFQPRIIVPAGAASWTDDRIDVVLAHELAHIVRRDWALQILAEVVRAVHWFNPLVWITCRRLRDESEQACDDAVLRRGLNPVDYASHLLAVARHVLADGRTWASAPAVADPSTLERRVAAMLTVSCNRQALTRTAAAFTLAGMCAVAVPLAAVTLTERRASTPVSPPARSDIALALSEHQRVEGLVAPQPAMPPVKPMTAPRRALPRAAASAVAAPPQAPASVSGVLSDASGAVLPGVQLTLTNAVSNVSSSSYSDASGRFVFRNVAPAAYRLEAKLPGFATMVNELTIGSGEDVQRKLTLRVGSLTESVVVNCATAAAAATNPTVPAPRRAQARPAFDLRYAASRLWTGVRASLGIAPTFAAQATPVRVGGQIKAPRRTKDVRPACPAIPIGSGGVVLLEATLGVDGLMKDMKILKSIDGRPEFGQTAIEAVRQWEYTPTLLNNVPTPVIVTISVVYAPISKTRSTRHSPDARLGGKGMSSRTTVAMLAVAATVVAGALEAFSQTPASSSTPPPKFEVASIRANKSGDVNRRITIPSPETFTATNITVRLLIQDAYRHPSGRMRREYEIVGWPDWTETEGFDVTAKSSTPVQDSQLRTMLQALLVDRFHLKLHTETRDLPTYALVLNRADGEFGPQLQKSTGECQPFAGRGAAPAAPVKPGQTRTCGFSGSRGPGQMNAVNVTMTQFANALANQVDREVADKTGLTGTFDLTLQFMPQRRLPLAPVGLPASADAPSIFTAVREQLGLRLDNQRAPADVLVIDAVERPTEN